jgi:sugar lactone lactonase YvrE
MKKSTTFTTLVSGLFLSLTVSTFVPQAHGQIFVSYNSGVIRRFDSGGVATNFATGLSTPKGLAIKAGFLYVANSGANTILKFPTGGGSPVTFASTGLNSPFGLVFNSTGDLYAANHSSSTIQKLDNAGSLVAPFPVTSANMNGPDGLAVDGSGNFYAASANNNTIQKFDSAGAFISDFVSFAGGLSAPRGLAIRDGVLYVANYISSTIKMFALSDGSALGNFANSTDGLLNPVGIAFDDAGSLYVANAGNQNVLKFTAPHVSSLFSNIYNQSPDFIAIQCEPAVLTIALYAGITLQGSVGGQYRIDYATSLSPTPVVWTPLTTLTLTNSPVLYVDTSSPTSSARFYRAVSVE